eukprot:1896246-Pyramimonas_sp.AAC.1
MQSLWESVSRSFPHRPRKSETSQPAEAASPAVQKALVACARTRLSVYWKAYEKQAHSLQHPSINDNQRRNDPQTWGWRWRRRSHGSSHRGP